ncbi:hypothetical protein O181_010425 [Austropuccinia psidii MF-1]|uniref:Peptidase S49 domain-containing protein n=1 Tax=Austropuccinia psidii MF-1 TaxID=1389203 RepID=A0A9Q3GKW1_9BASI|nr:hypothetical protein [Austropuccinia psidii MF-1]
MSESNPSPSPIKPGDAPEQPKLGPFKRRWNRLASSRLGQRAQFAYTWRRPIFFGIGASFFLGRYIYAKYQIAKRDRIHPGTYLVWRLYDGAVVEYPSHQTNLSMVLGSSGDGADPPRVMTLDDVIRTLKFIQTDDRITGIIADLSSTNAPSVNQDIPLGLAQIEEIQSALFDLKEAKESRLGRGKFKTVAFTETFRSQGEYTMASGFDKIYCQPSGELPLVGINSTVTFYSRLLSWLGIKVHAEARTQYKSMVAPYTQNEFSEPQAENHMELLTDLNTNMLSIIAHNRSRSKDQKAGDKTAFKEFLERLRGYAKRGPLGAKEATELGLIDGTMYKEELLSKVILGDNPVVIDETNKELVGKAKLDALKQVLKTQTKGFYHYHKIMDRLTERKNKDGVLNIGVVYVLGTIGDVGEFGTGAIVKGLQEAGEDDTIGAVILRIDSGGGGVVESDTIWGAVKELKAKGKVVIASFGNTAASGGYLIATHADSILASPSTITGSIGVASLRPTVTPSFFERIKLNTQSFFTGSKALSLYHELEEEPLARHKAHIDAAYADFKHRVCEGRNISPELIELLAGGRVYTGLKMWDLNEKINEQASIIVEADTLGETQSQALIEEVQINIPDLDDSELVNPTSTSEAAASPSASKNLSELISSAITSIQSQPGGVDLSGVQEVVTVENSTTNTPLGRGIIDGIGGIREAALEGAETYLSRLINQTKQMHPAKTPAEIMEEVLPGVPYVVHENGETSLTFDIRLKKFPVHKTFWQQLSEASKRGDAIEGSVSSIFSFAKQSFAQWISRVVLQHMETETVNSLGMKPSDLNKWKSLIRQVNRPNNSNSTLHAQMHPWNFQ